MIANIPVRPPELKYSETSGGVTSPNALGYVQCLNAAIAQGTDYNQRVGREVVGKYIELDLVFHPPTTAGNYDFATVSLVYDTEPNGGVASYGAIFDGVILSGLSSCQWFKNMQASKGRFRIVRTIRTQMIANDNEQARRYYINYNIPAMFNKTTYVAAAAGTPAKGAWLLAISSYRQTASSETGFFAATGARFAYVDS